MCVTTDNRVNASRREPGHVVSHHHRRTAQEAVRREHHASHPDRNQPVEATPMRLDDQLHWIRAIGRCPPHTQALARNLAAQSSAHCVPLRARARRLAKGGIDLAVRRRQDGMSGRPQGHDLLLADCTSPYRQPVIVSSSSFSMKVASLLAAASTSEWERCTPGARAISTIILRPFTVRRQVPTFISAMITQPTKRSSPGVCGWPLACGKLITG